MRNASRSPPFAARLRLRAQGFTLIEVLVAVVVFAMLSAVLFGSLYATVNGPPEVLARQERYVQVMQALDRMARETAMAYISKAIMDPNASNETWRTLFRVKDEGDKDRIDFTAFAHIRLAADAKESDQTEISYFVDRDRDPELAAQGVYTLFRRHSRRIDHDPDKGGFVYPMLRDVRRFQIQAYDPEMKEWKDEWDTWKIEKLGKMPPYVRYTVVLKGPDDTDEIFSTVAEVRLLQPLDFAPQRQDSLNRFNPNTPPPPPPTEGGEEESK